MGSSVATRIGLIAAAAILAVGAFLNAYANVVGDRSPAQAVAIPWAGPKAFNAAVDRQLATQQYDQAEIKQLAMRSLNAQLLNPPALRTMAMLRGLGGDEAGATRVIGFAERMSRRDLGTQLWLIEQAVSRGDLDEALRHYDIALRTSRASSQMLFPILSKAIADPAIRLALKPYVVGKAAWVPRFLMAAANDAGSIEDAAKVVFDAGRVPTDKAFEAVSETFIPNLAASRKWDALRTYYLRMPGANPALLQSTAFKGAALDRDLVPLSWAVTDQPNLYGEFQSGTDGGDVLSVSAQDSSSGWVAQKILYLPRRRYTAAVAYEWTEGAEGAQAALAIYCGDNQGGAPILRLPLASSATLARANFTVPDRCVAQVARIELRGGYDKPLSLIAKRIVVQPATG